MPIGSSTILATARSVIRGEGLTSLFKQILSGLFLYDECIVVRKDLDTVEEVKPRIENCVLKIISSQEELLDLVKKGFDIDSHFNPYELQQRLDQGEILFAVFVNGHLAHKTWVLMHDTGTIDMPIVNGLGQRGIHPVC